MREEEYHSANLAKYRSLNPVKRFLLVRFINRIEQLVTEVRPESILDVGCGEGIMLTRLAKIINPQKIVGIDLSKPALAVAKKNIPTARLIQMDAMELAFADNSFDLVLLLEVLEHLRDPLQAIKEAKRVTSKYCIFSVPDEPWFSLLSLLAGMHITRLGKHPEHRQFWSFSRFAKLVAAHFSRTYPVRCFPWSIVLAEK